jgi:hypothetical protein
MTLADASAIRQAEQELDSVVAEIGAAMLRAEQTGDKAGARIYADRMYAAIASRTPAHITRLEREALERLDEGDFTGSWTDNVCGRFDVKGKAKSPAAPDGKENIG